MAYTANEAAYFLHCHPNTIHNLIRSGQVKSFTLGRKRLIARGAIEELIAAGGTEGWRNGRHPRRSRCPRLLYLGLGLGRRGEFDFPGAIVSTMNEAMERTRPQADDPRRHAVAIRVAFDGRLVYDELVGDQVWAEVTDTDDSAAYTGKPTALEAALEAGRRWRASRVGNNRNSPLAARRNYAGRSERSRDIRKPKP